ncbi:MAG: hypothetical protein R2991_05165 [Thermoanaerobaculia bacterium]
MARLSTRSFDRHLAPSLDEADVGALEPIDELGQLVGRFDADEGRTPRAR